MTVCLDALFYEVHSSKFAIIVRSGLDGIWLKVFCPWLPKEKWSL